AKVMVNGSPAGMVVQNANVDELEKRLRTELPTAVAQPFFQFIHIGILHHHARRAAVDHDLGHRTQYGAEGA
ncbi:hypothetical protein, partial [Aeromonas caviae]|uniref:hypothetical protein n=1 Tax=Aeromonas caviae TaxID=648 RepID=UPI001CC739CA